jgi:hypothetical protein
VSDIDAMSELAIVQLQLPPGTAAVVTNGRTVIDFSPAAGNGTLAPGNACSMQARLTVMHHLLVALPMMSHQIHFWWFVVG